MSICTNEKAEDFQFIFSILKDVLKKLYDFDFRPHSLVADGAEAISQGFMKAFEYESIEDFNRIMCWPHVDRNCRKYVPKNYEDKIMHDISLLQLAHSHETFAYQYQLFVDKWNLNQISKKKKLKM